jgi:hypothetical protein
MNAHMMELLAPAGSMEQAKGAIDSGTRVCKGTVCLSIQWAEDDTVALPGKKR